MKSSQLLSVLSASRKLRVTSFCQLQTLITLSSLRPGETTTPTRISKSLGVSSAAATGIIDHLVNLGLASRNNSQTDRRLILVGITPAGLAAAKSLHLSAA